jgi:glutathione synthase/RimK-type ligase-like ATP-grasp enzyme
MILLCGIPSESPLRMVREALEELGADFRVFNQRRAADCALAWRIEADGVGGTLDLQGEKLDLSTITGAYLRLMDDRLLPELEGEAEGSPARARTRGLHDALYRWLEVAPGRIVNRADPQGSNASKPYQSQTIRRFGFETPETLISNDPDAIRAFRRKHQRIIFKSMSGVRSIVREFDESDDARLEDVRWCPVQFQAYVPGVDMRVHVVGDQCFATEIVSDRTDYRYARQHGGVAELVAVELDDALQSRCVSLSRGLRLAFAGIDLRRTSNGSFYCFEVNPCPAFSYYEANTGQPIAAAVAHYLIEGVET